ncbi:hypothetical protein, partial [Klebsiella michiganensis]|uniref:hypothetical protein n=1 Tax=Klebsiella michiganensis TaxID=1134687 RepID=UPI001BD45D8A
ALHRWHTWTANEMSASEIDRATFAEYQTREAAIFRDMKSSITRVCHLYAGHTCGFAPLNPVTRCSTLPASDLFSCFYAAYH